MLENLGFFIGLALHQLHVERVFKFGLVEIQLEHQFLFRVIGAYGFLVSSLWLNACTNDSALLSAMVVKISCSNRGLILI